MPGGFRGLPTLRGAGRPPESNGGSSGARLGYPGARPIEWAVAWAKRKCSGKRRAWRAEVGPMLRGAGPRPLLLRFRRTCSLERLVFAEVGHGHSQRIDGNQFVGYLGLENEDEIRGVQLALQLGMVGGRVIDHVEVHAGAERRRLHLFERDL